MGRSDLSLASNETAYLSVQKTQYTQMEKIEKHSDVFFQPLPQVG